MAPGGRDLRSSDDAEPESVSTVWGGLYWLMDTLAEAPEVRD